MGMVGSSIWRKLISKGYTNLIGKTSKELDLRNQKSVNNFFKFQNPDIVVNAAAKVGGIIANRDYPYNFLMENMQIQNNIIDAAFKSAVKKFIFLGSSCIYPKLAKQPLREDYLLSDYLEPTNECYAIAKISGVKACQSIRKQFGKDFISLMPTNLYGFHDNFDLKSSHVLPSMIRKFHEAKENNHSPVKLWGTGKPKREFMYVDDLADAIIFVLENKLSGHLYNVGVGSDISIKDLAKTVQKIVLHRGEILWDSSKPDGSPRKLMDISKMSELGWKSKTSLEQGIKKTYDWFLKNIDNIKENKLEK